MQIEREPTVESFERRSLTHSMTRRFSMGNVKVTIRPESPRTLQACKELGIDTSCLNEHKSIESFGGPEVAFEIKNLRFKHYNKRMIDLIMKIIQKKKEIKGRHPGLQEQNSIAESMATSSTNNALNKSNTSEMLKNLPKKISDTFRKTVTYIKQSHHSPNVISSQEIINDFSEVPDFDQRMQNEIEKFNEMKRRKQKKVLMIYKEEKKKLEAKENWEKNLKKVEELTGKSKSEKMKRLQEFKELFDERRQKAVETGKEYKKKLFEDQKNIYKKLAKIEERRQNEEEFKRKKQSELGDMLSEKQRRHKENQEQLSKTEAVRWFDNIKDINKKLLTAKENTEKVQDEKRKAVMEKLKNEEKILISYQQIYSELTEEKFQKHMEKLNKKKFAFETLHKRQMEEKEKKESEKKEKEEKRGELNIQNIKENVKKKKTFAQRVERVEMRKQEILRELEKERLLKIEEKRLRDEDQRENNEREKNKTELRISNLVEKEKRLKLKLEIEKQKQDYLRQIRLEAALHGRLEDERLEAGINAVTYLMNDNRRSAPLLRKSDKIKKELNNEDIKKYQIARCIMSDEDFEEIKDGLIPPRENDDAENTDPEL